MSEPETIPAQTADNVLLPKLETVAAVADLAAFLDDEREPPRRRGPDQCEMPSGCTTAEWCKANRCYLDPPHASASAV